MKIYNDSLDITQGTNTYRNEENNQASISKLKQKVSANAAKHYMMQSTQPLFASRTNQAENDLNKEKYMSADKLASHRPQHNKNV